MGQVHVRQRGEVRGRSKVPLMHGSNVRGEEVTVKGQGEGKQREKFELITESALPSFYSLASR